jgi:glutamate synthase (NADPH/NADH) large chain
VLDLDPAKVVRRMRLQPGRMFLVNMTEGRIVSDEEIKAELAAEQPYQDWLDKGLIPLAELPQGDYERMLEHRVLLRQLVFGYTYEELNLLVAPMARTGAEPLGSMGTDTPVAVLSQRPRMLFDYFQQLFAQVTNPPLDAIREEVVTSLQGTVGPEGDLLNPNADSCRQINLPSPILRNHELAKLINLDPDVEVNGRRHGLRSKVISCLFPVAENGAGLKAALDEVRAQTSAAIADGARIIILSDRAPPPGPRTQPHQGRPRRRERRRPRGASHGRADRLRRGGDQPVHGVRVDRGHARPRRLQRPRPRDSAEQLHQGRRQGCAQSDVQDGHLDAGLLHRCPAIPGRRRR